mmetsp:Transcript_24237/g.55359  ORF Transcript_24237/g.55359 Transcript_24237/m.55359 type:complete len:174 (-) Transcript_24237:144-665(-)
MSDKEALRKLLRGYRQPSASRGPAEAGLAAGRSAAAELPPALVGRGLVSRWSRVAEDGRVLAGVPCAVALVGRVPPSPVLADAGRVPPVTCVVALVGRVPPPLVLADAGRAPPDAADGGRVTAEAAESGRSLADTETPRREWRCAPLAGSAPAEAGRPRVLRRRPPGKGLSSK